MTDEDRTAERLKGNNCLIKFKDGEELLLELEAFHDEDDTAAILTDLEQFINGNKDYLMADIPGIALNRELIKYIRKI